MDYTNYTTDSRKHKRMCQDVLGRIFEPLSYMISTAT